MILPSMGLVRPRRADLAVKHRFFQHLLGGNDPDAERVYRWHIQARRGSGFVDGEKQKDNEADTIDHYVEAAQNLLISMSNSGFSSSHPIPIDPNNELLGGAHRLACAIALDKSIYVMRQRQFAWAPSWGLQWFIDQGMDDMDLLRLETDFRMLCPQ